jgi:hypothetical protein
MQNLIKTARVCLQTEKQRRNFSKAHEKQRYTKRALSPQVISHILLSA